MEVWQSLPSVQWSHQQGYILSLWIAVRWELLRHWDLAVFSDSPNLLSLASDFTSPQGTEPFIRRAIFMQKNSGVKLSENEICMLASGEERLIFPRLMNNPCLPYNSHEFVKCPLPVSFSKIITDESNDAILSGKKKHNLCFKTVFWWPGIMKIKDGDNLVINSNFFHYCKNGTMQQQWPIIFLTQDLHILSPCMFVITPAVTQNIISFVHTMLGVFE